MTGRNGARLSHAGVTAVKQDEPGPWIRRDDLHQEQWIGALDARMARVDLEGKLVPRAEFNELPEDEIFKIFQL